MISEHSESELSVEVESLAGTLFLNLTVDVDGVTVTCSLEVEGEATGREATGRVEGAARLVGAGTDEGAVRLE